MARFVRMLLREQKVWALVGADGRPLADERGRVEIRYRLEDERTYSAASPNLVPIPGEQVHERDAARTAAAPRRRARARSPRAGSQLARQRPTADEVIAPIVIYTDGACTGNPGPMGIGAVLVAGKLRKEISEYLGIGTNNIAELTAVLRALEAVKDRERTVLLHSDSTYAIGVLAKGWKAKANQELVARIRTLAATFRDLRFVKVQGHAGVPENERCDELAREAIDRRQ